jgi:hypothetical protein
MELMRETKWIKRKIKFYIIFLGWVQLEPTTTTNVRHGSNFCDPIWPDPTEIKNLFVTWPDLIRGQTFICDLTRRNQGQRFIFDLTRPDPRSNIYLWPNPTRHEVKHLFVTWPDPTRGQTFICNLIRRNRGQTFICVPTRGQKFICDPTRPESDSDGQEVGIYSVGHIEFAFYWFKKFQSAENVFALVLSSSSIFFTKQRFFSQTGLEYETLGEYDCI